MSILIVPDDFASIQAAINGAIAGDEIQVKTGTYAESVLISGKTNILITGVDTGAGLPVIAPVANTHAPYDCAAGIIAGCSGVSLENFILNNTVGGGEKNYGVLIVGSANTTIQAIEVTSAKNGIVLQANGAVTCTGTVVNGCNVHNLTYALASEGIGLDDQGGTSGALTLTNTIFNTVQYGAGLSPRDAAGVIGNYIVTGCTFQTVAQTGLAVECNEGGGTNSATILAYHNVFDTCTVDAAFSETTVTSTLTTPNAVVYCWLNIPHLAFTGNYWSDHTSPDTNNDGIVDTPKVISARHQDAAPLVNHWGTAYTTCRRIHGYVYDAGEIATDNVPIPISGINVTITDPETGTVQTAVTDATGLFYFSDPPEGSGMLLECQPTGYIKVTYIEAVTELSNISQDFYLWPVRIYQN